MTKILVVDDSVVDRGLIAGILRERTNWNIEFAFNGDHALELMPLMRPDAVLTDLQMPGMNGLELVSNLRSKYPDLPINLVTSQGSEDLAIEALRVGANLYTPKRLMSTRLVDDMHSVLDAARRLRNQRRLMNNVVSGSISWELESDSGLVAPLIEQVQAFVADWNQSDQLRLGMALDEALNNAMFHGNLEVDSSLRQEDDHAFHELAKQRASTHPFSQRRVFINAEFCPEQLSIRIRDEGPGYNPADLDDPTDPSNLEKLCGRGLLLIKAFMDEVTINDVGNEIAMIKRPSSANDEC